MSATSQRVLACVAQGYAWISGDGRSWPDDLTTLAREVEAAEKRVAELEAALRPFVDVMFVGPEVSAGVQFRFQVTATAEEIRRARAAASPSWEDEEWR